MNPKYGNASTAFNQALSVIRVLETECDVWTLKTRDIPIWWFVRGRFYTQLLKHFDREQGEAPPINRVRVFESLSHLLSACSKAMIFGIRSLCGMIGLTRLKARFRKGPIMFLSVPAAFRGVKREGLSDIYFDPIYRRIANKSIVVERTSLSKWDFHSLLFRKDAIFFDWMLLRAILKLFPYLWETPKTEGWRAFYANCQGVDFGSISCDRLLDMLHSVIDGLSRKVIVQVEASKMLLQKVNPKAIVEICSYDSAPRAMNLVARKHGIPIIELQHGLISQNMSYNYFVPDDYQGEKPLPNKILVYGDASKQSILGAGTAFSSGNIDVVGFPRLSEFLKKLKSEGRDSLREKTRDHLRLPQDAFVLTITSQPTTSHCLSNFLKKALERLEGDDFTVLIKPHPSEAETWKRSYGDIIQDRRVRILTDKDIDLYELLVASDVHATVCSTVFLECFALGVPNIIIGCPGYSNVLQLVDQNEIIIVKDPSEFIAQLKRLNEDAEYGEMIVKKGAEASGRFFASDNSPVDAIIKEIEQCSGAQ